MLLPFQQAADILTMCYWHKYPNHERKNNEGKMLLMQKKCFDKWKSDSRNYRTQRNVLPQNINNNKNTKCDKKSDRKQRNEYSNQRRHTLTAFETHINGKNMPNYCNNSQQNLVID